LSALNGRVSRRGVLTAGGAAVAGAAAATVIGGGLKTLGDQPAGDPNPITPGPAEVRVPSTMVIPVDQLAASDDERILAINQRNSQAGGKEVPVFEFASRVYTISTPINLYSGLKLLGSSGLPAREYAGGTTIRWAGPPDTSIFAFPAEGQTNQSYPADGSPRDMSITGLLFEGGSRTDVFPRLAMTADSYRGHTLWYTNLHNLGVRDMRTFWWGYGTGVSVTGTFHAQAMSDTPLFIGGSENTIFGNDAQSFMDNSSAAWASGGKPFIRSVMEKSFIGRVIITARTDAFHLSIEGGQGLVVNGVQFDAPSASPTNGKMVGVSNVDGLTITNCIFNAGMAQPAADSRAIIDVSGGRGVVVEGNQFLGGSDRPQPSDTALVANSAAVPLKLGLNGFPGYTGLVRGNVVSVDPAVHIIPM
jgi:hypothetical protein